MIPPPNPLAQPLQHLPRPFEILRLKINLPTEPDPPRPRVEYNRHKCMMILHHRHNQPLRRGRRVLLPDLTRRTPNLQRQPNVREAAFRQTPLLVIQHLRLQYLRHRNTARLHELGTVAHDLLLAAADFLAEFQGIGDAEVGRVVDGADEFKLLDELALGAWREGVVDLRPARNRVGFEAVGCGQGGANQGLVPEWDVEDGAAAGNEQPPDIGSVR